MNTHMTIKHHLNEQLLMGYAAGILPEAFSLVIATQVSISDEARARLESYEAIGIFYRNENKTQPRYFLSQNLDRECYLAV
mgnify:CR=1 FL=1